MSGNEPATAAAKTHEWGPCCPDWAQNHWNAAECTIVPLTGGGYGALDHGIQTLVFTDRDKGKVERYLESHGHPPFKDEDDDF